MYWYIVKNTLLHAAFSVILSVEKVHYSVYASEECKEVGFVLPKIETSSPYINNKQATDILVTASIKHFAALIICVIFNKTN